MNRRVPAALRGIAIALPLVLSLAACAQGTLRQNAQATSTASDIQSTAITPTVQSVTLTLPAIHSISLGNYQTSLALPGAAGLVLDPVAPSNASGMPSLAFYSYSTQQVQEIATAPTVTDGTPSGILGSAYAGDWVTYVTADNPDGTWTLWGFNVINGQRIQIADNAKDGSNMWGAASWVSDPTDVVWSLVGYTNGNFTSKLLDYTFTTGQTRILYTDPTHSITPKAMTDAAILLVIASANNQAATWLLQNGASAPTQISIQTAGNGWMTNDYAAWDVAHLQSITLYNLATGKETDNWVASCMRPAVADPQPYAVCLDFGADSFDLVHVPDGTSTPFDQGNAKLGSGGQIYNGRAFWIGSTNSTVDYFDLPAQ